ncbi:hypothetical protein [Agrobacterium sp. 22117]|uniref:hypothetical protein n=1 Tax=Agrobacterium sp. 22117 TaxID=3453880 RepID=UPI003F869E38
MENEIDLYLQYDAEGNLTVSVVPDNGNTLFIPAGTPPVERDDRINSFKAEQQAV